MKNMHRLCKNGVRTGDRGSQFETCDADGDGDVNSDGNGDGSDASDGDDDDGDCGSDSNVDGDEAYCTCLKPPSYSRLPAGSFFACQNLCAA